MSEPKVLVLGGGQLADATARAITAGGGLVVRLVDPDDTGIREALDETVDHVVVISRSDPLALRWALVVTHLRPDVPTLVTVFDRHVAAELQESSRHVRVMSMAAVVAPALAAPCLDPALMSLVCRAGGTVGVAPADGAPRTVPRTWRSTGVARRALANLEALARPFDTSARILVYGLVGVLAVLAAETAALYFLKDVPGVEAFYQATKVVVTVGPSPATDTAEPGVQVFSAIGMILTLGFAAMLTAGIVNRLMDARLTGLVGRAAVPRRDHVIVVGLGQVGHRLCELLRDLDVPVVAVDQDPGPTDVARAKERRLPVVVGDGADHRTLTRVSIRSARAVAAVTSDEVENIAVAAAARRFRPGLPLALRAGDGDATTETSALFHLAVVRDVYRIAGTAFAAAVLGHDVAEAFPFEGTMYLVDEPGTIEPLALERAAP